MIFSKPNRKRYITVFVLLFATAINSCKRNDDTPILTNIKLNETELTMNVGEQQQLNITTEIYGNSVVWESSDEGIAVVNDQGIITTVAGGTVNIIVKVDNVRARCIVTVNPDVFFIQREVEDEIPVFWKNGQETNLGNKADIILNSIFIDKDDVYVTGEEWFSDGNGFLWKNGEMQNLPLSSGRINELKSFFKDEEGNEYMCGEIFTFDNEKIPVYWINGIENLMEVTPPSSILFREWNVDIYDMYVGNENVYMVGNQRVSGNENLATLWKNGLIQTISGDKTKLNFESVFAADGDVFVVGYERVSDTQTVATYWKNGVAVALNSGNNSAFAKSMAIAGNGDVYVTGLQFIGAQSQAIYWKNGELMILDNGSNGSSTNDIFIFDDNIYITGYSSNEDADFAYWKNGMPVTISNNEFRGGSWSLFAR